MPTLVSLVDAHSRKRDSITLKLTRALLRIWSSPRWYEEDWVQAAAARSASLTEQAVLAAYRASWAYQKATARLDGVQTRDLTARPEWTYARSGHVTPFEVYQRPAQTYRYNRSRGVSETNSRQRALTRLEALAQADVTLGARRGYQDSFKAHRYKRYRRIIHPELGAVCGLCIVAADRVYSVKKLLPIHDRCNCTVMGYTTGSRIDHGLLLNEEDREALYKAARGTGDGLKDVRFEELEHGELGLVLVDAKSTETDEHRANTESRTTLTLSTKPHDLWRAELEALEPLNTRLERAGSRYSVAANWASLRANELSSRLRAA